MRTQFTHQDPQPSSHAYNDPDLSPIEFLYAVMRATHQPMSIRIQAASALLPYTHPYPRPTNSIPRCTIVIPPFEPRTPNHEAHEGDNGKSQSFSEIADNTCHPQSGGPGPSNMMTIPEPSTFIDYSTPPTPAELQEIKAAINRLRPDLAHLPVPEPHLCACGHWIFGPCPLGERCCDRTKLN